MRRAYAIFGSRAEYLTQRLHREIQWHMEASAGDARFVRAGAEFVEDHQTG
jgi:hypothetical protein